ncbi:MAG: metallophosphoesterase, partial [candidate division Zixibacteria bacterium]|nr:metallophosphoesterase [candidate division Zixibacteria bacterium]
MATPHPLRFAIIGDRTGSHRPGIYEEIVVEVERMRPDFVITVGDMIEDSQDTAWLEKEWKEYKSIIAPLTMPIYFTPGNNDIAFDIALGPYERNIGQPYYSFDRPEIYAHFIILDNSRWESSKELPKEQIDWLIADLKSHPQRNYYNTLVFFHKPFWFETLTEGRADTLHTLFKNFGVRAVFNGHFHQYHSAK